MNKESYRQEIVRRKHYEGPDLSELRPRFRRRVQKALDVLNASDNPQEEIMVDILTGTPDSRMNLEPHNNGEFNGRLLRGRRQVNRVIVGSRVSSKTRARLAELFGYKPELHQAAISPAQQPDDEAIVRNPRIPNGVVSY